MPEWEYRYYSYNAHWDENEQMASMRDGEGDHYFALFQPTGLIIKGFDQRFNRVHGPHDVLQGNQAWSASKELDAEAYHLLHILNGKADHYYAWATEYYEISLDRSLVQRIFDIEPLDGKMLKGLNEELEFADLEEDIQEIGYPVKRED
ncbi:hypothetical protein [Paenibacillus polymyxa]|uniref:hypothetical protein n=1 Tax=Paenibacillus polymyxa TaxID=1406 RepID=UPI00201D83E6|nr:hypothetical protein [Paenibacillus polymyxa]